METHTVAWKQTEWPEETVLREKLYGDTHCGMETDKMARGNMPEGEALWRQIVVKGNIPGGEAPWRHTVWHGNRQNGLRKQS